MKYKGDKPCHGRRHVGRSGDSGTYIDTIYEKNLEYGDGFNYFIKLFYKGG